MCFRFDPTTAGRRHNIVSSLLNPEKVKLDDSGSAIETWEEKARAYEARGGPDGERKETDDDIKSGALQPMCPESLQTHLSMNHQRLQDYASVRAEITSDIEARVGIRMTAIPSNVRDPNAMDIGSLASKGPGGKGKGQRDYSHAQCHGCGEYGHIKPQCPYKKGKG